jgi:hypothetical protein
VSEHNDALPGERYDDAPAPPRISRRHGALMIGLAGVCVAGYFAFHSQGEYNKDAGGNRPASISQIATFEPMKAQSANLQKPTATPPAPMRQALVQETPVEDPLTKARLAPAGGRQQHPDAARARPASCCWCRSAWCERRVRAGIEAARDHSGRH